MLDRVILFSIKNKFIIGLFTLALIGVGSYSLYKLPIDALPDITNNQVQIITTSPTLATQEVEQFITYPVELAVKPIPNVVEMRSTSRFGLSVVTVVFKESVDIYWARAQISERLKEAENSIPKGLGTPEMAPISTGLGEIYQYVVYPKKGYEDKYDATELRSIQDWIIRPQLLGTPGVAEVNTLGGYLKQYEIAIDPDKLKSMNTTVVEIFDALEKNNENTGGAYIEKKPYSYFIRGIGVVTDMEDIGKIVVKTQNGIPILVRDVATVRVGASTRFGAITKDGKGEEVGGAAMMLKGENSLEVVSRVKEKIAQIQKSLPEGVAIEAFLDRSELIDRAISTVEKNLIEGALIVIFILVLFLGNWRAGLVVASVIPLSLLFAVTMMHLFGVSGNLMSLGAIDFGLIVDGAVIIVEAIIHGLQSRAKMVLSSEQMDNEVYKASSKIRSSAAFGEIIILIVYLPILALVGIEGKMFGPMAQTVSFAILGAFLLSLTYIPMMSALVLKREAGHKKNFSDKLMEGAERLYRPLLNGALKMKTLVVGVAVALLVIAFIIFGKLGGEFIPNLDEGDLAVEFSIAPGSSLSQEVETTLKAEKLLKERIPEVKRIVAKIGSAEIPTDPMPMEAGDMIILLKDQKDWTTAHSKKELIEKMEEVLDEIPGVNVEFSQPIQMRFNELMTGVRSDVAVKIFGDDLDLLLSEGDEVLNQVRTVNGVVDAKVERVAGLPQITVRYNKDKLALYGLNVGDLNKVIRTGFAGEKTGVVYEKEKRIDIVLRLAQDSRKDISNLKTLYVTLPSGSQIPLEQVADVSYEPGPMQISRENGKRRIVVGFNVRGRDVESVVKDIQKKLDAKLKLPAGYYVTYGGQFENLVQASERLSVAVPIALALIFVLLFFTFRSVKQSLLIFTAIPFSAIGGVFALWVRDMPFSISAGVGFIALFGVAVLNGIVLISYFNHLKKEGMENVMDRVREGTKVRLRPVLLTASVASLGFLPMALSTSAGAEVQKPLATVVIGGLITATLLTLVVLPILYIFFESGKLKLKGSSLKTAVLIPVILLLGRFSGYSQQPALGLKDAIELGMKNNQLIQAGELNIQAQTQLRPTAFELPKTDLTGMFGQYNTSAFDQNYMISQSVNPFQFRAKMDVVDASVQTSEIQLGQTQNEIRFLIRQSWFNLLYLNEINQHLISQDSLLEEFVKASELRFKSGDVNELEKSTAIVKQKELQQRIRQNQMNLAAEQTRLKTLLGLKTDFTVNETLKMIPFVGTLDSAALEENPQLKLALQEIKLAEANQKLQRSNLYPDLSAGYFIQSLTGNQDVSGQTIYYNGAPRFQGFTLGVSIPIFAGSSIARSKSAATTVLVQQANADYTKEQLKNQYYKELQQLITLQSAVEFYENSVLPSAKVVARNASIAYRQGDISYVEYLQGIQTALDTQISYVNVLNQYNQSVSAVQYLLNQ